MELTADAFWSRINTDPDIMHGLPCIKGTRIPVYQVVNMLADGETEQCILDEYPSLNVADIHAALKYAAALAKRETFGLSAVA
jgi:uncharacterized protein (DUF433 family)